MSLLTKDMEASGQCHEHPCNAVSRIIDTRQKDIGGFHVRRVLPDTHQKMVGPWIFFDHMGPATFEPGNGLDVRPHPHINLATVTYLFEGAILHRDSLGSEQLITPGDVNLMIAGNGIVHSERSPQDLRDKGHTLHGLQLWLALPDNQEEIEPEFLHYAEGDLPKTQIDGVDIRVMIGQAYGLQSPVKTLSPTLYFEADLKVGDTITLPDNVSERAVYVASGELTTHQTTLHQYSMTVFDSKPDVSLTAIQDSRIALVGGEPVGDRFIWWNFVSSDKTRIKKAQQDWEQGNFPKVPGDEQEFIPLPK